MLLQPTGSGLIKILGIDPGTDTMGYAPLVYDPVTRKITGKGVHTFSAKYEYKYRKECVDIHGEKYTRLFAQADHLASLLNEFEPDYIIGEAIYYSRRRAQAFRGLSECWMVIRSVVNQWKPTFPIMQIEPVPAKQNLGVGVGKGKRAELKDKGLVEREVLRRKDMTFDADSNPDEHSFDATAIGLYLIDHQLRCETNG